MPGQNALSLAGSVERLGPERFGRDHWALLAYLETLVVDAVAERSDEDGTAAVGTIDRERMRCNPVAHPHLMGQRQLVGGSVDASGRYLYPSRVRGREVPGHDDWHVLDDLEAAGWVEAISVVNGFVRLTPAGLTVALALRAHKASGGTLAAFVPPS